MLKRRMVELENEVIVLRNENEALRNRLTIACAGPVSVGHKPERDERVSCSGLQAERDQCHREQYTTSRFGHVRL